MQHLSIQPQSSCEQGVVVLPQHRGILILLPSTLRLRLDLANCSSISRQDEREASYGSISMVTNYDRRHNSLIDRYSRGFMDLVSIDELLCAVTLVR